MACYAYVFPCQGEDHCKVGFSRDPLARIMQLHRRWFGFFDLQQGLLVEGETVRDARDLELELRRPLAAHRAPVPMTIHARAGGHTEWLRGALPQIRQAADALAVRGHRLHAPLSDWLHDALRARAELLYDWTGAQLTVDELEHRIATPRQAMVRDALDAYPALGIPLEPLLPAQVWDWYRGSAPR